MTMHPDDLEARLRTGLPRLANMLLEGPRAATVAETPGAFGVARGVRPFVRPLAVAAVTIAVAVGAVGLVLSLRSDTATRNRSSDVAGAVGPVKLPPAPLSARSAPVLAWTGRSLMVWGGYRGEPTGVPEALLDGAEYPAAGTWTPIRPNQWGHPGAVGVWAGDRLVVLAKNGGAEYDAVGARAWRLLPELVPSAGSFVAVAESGGTVYGLVTGLMGPSDSIGIARLDGGAKVWRLMARTRLGGRASSFSLIERAGRLDLWADGMRVAQYHVAGNAWAEADGLTVPEGFAQPLVTKVGETVATVDGGGAQGPAVLDPSTNRWWSLPGGAATTSAGSTAIGAGDRLFVWGGQANPGTWTWDLAATDPCRVPSGGRATLCPDEFATAAQVAARLTAAGHTVTSDAPGSRPSGLLGTEPVVMCVDRRTIQVYEYESAAERARHADAIQPDGSFVYPEGDTTRHVIPEWIATPHFFAAGRVIVVYVGGDVSLLRTLADGLGAPIPQDLRTGRSREINC